MQARAPPKRQHIAGRVNIVALDRQSRPYGITTGSEPCPYTLWAGGRPAPEMREAERVAG